MNIERQPGEATSINVRYWPSVAGHGAEMGLGPVTAAALALTRTV